MTDREVLEKVLKMNILHDLDKFKARKSGEEQELTPLQKTYKEYLEVTAELDRVNKKKEILKERIRNEYVKNAKLTLKLEEMEEKKRAHECLYIHDEE